MSFLRITRPVRITNYEKTKLEPIQEEEIKKLVEKVKKNLLKSEIKETRKFVKILAPTPRRHFPLKILIESVEDKQ